MSEKKVITTFYPLEDNELKGVTKDLVGKKSKKEKKQLKKLKRQKKALKKALRKVRDKIRKIKG